MIGPCPANCRQVCCMRPSIFRQYFSTDVPYLYTIYRKYKYIIATKVYSVYQETALHPFSNLIISEGNDISRIVSHFYIYSYMVQHTYAVAYVFEINLTIALRANIYNSYNLFTNMESVLINYGFHASYLRSNPLSMPTMNGLDNIFTYVEIFNIQ